MSLHPYMAHEGDPGDGAVLVFAHSAAQAKPLGFAELRGWSVECAFTDVRVKRLRAHVDYLMTLADQAKLAVGAQHVIDDLHTCPRCERWGVPPGEDGRTCLHCIDEEAIGG
jgi:hypothetical protein